ncbi:MAG: hypothetical protein IJO54_02630, partial [Oscillospiraceae bacterium]|nr:hypothetical protein [Oscillospiraceae bacterium]
AQLMLGNNGILVCRMDGSLQNGVTAYSGKEALPAAKSLIFVTSLVLRGKVCGKREVLCCVQNDRKMLRMTAQAMVLLGQLC